MTAIDLVYVAMKGDTEVFKEAFEIFKKENPNETLKNVPLSGQMLVSSIWNCNHEVAKMLVEAGAELDYQNEYGYTPVHALAYMHKRTPQKTDCELMRMMLNKGANPNIPNNNGGYAMLTLSTADGDFGENSLFKLILEYRPNVYQMYGISTSCKHCCQENHPDIYQLLIDEGLIETNPEKMNIYQLAEDGSFEDFKKIYTDAVLNEKDKYGNKLIYYALYGKKWETVYFLLQQDKKIEQNIKGIGNVLRYVLHNGKYPKENEIKTKDFIAYDETLMNIIKYLLSHGAKVNKDGGALSAALPYGTNIISDNEMEVINMLLKRHATVSRTAARYLKNDDPEIYKFIKEKGAIEYAVSRN